MVGQRVRVTRASADWDAPVGALGTVASYDGANDRGTDWAVGFLQDGAEAFDPSWPVDESYLEADGPGAFEPLPFDAHCLAPSGAWMDEIITCLEVEDPPDRDARLASSLTVLQPLVGGTALATEFIWHPRPAVRETSSRSSRHGAHAGHGPRSSRRCDGDSRNRAGSPIRAGRSSSPSHLLAPPCSSVRTPSASGSSWSRGPASSAGRAARATHRHRHLLLGDR